MNELIIIGILLAVFAAACAVDGIIANRDAIMTWLDREITAYYAAKIVKRRVRQQWARSRGAER